MRVVLDTNLVVSALLHDGSSRRFRELWESFRIRPVASQAVLDEYVRVLHYPKFGYPPELLAWILRRHLLPWLSKAGESKGGLTYPPGDPDDGKFLRAALSGGAKALVSGDKHLTDLDGRYPFPILRPAAFLERFFPRPGRPGRP